MRVLTPVIGVTILLVFHPWQYLALGGTFDLRLIRHDQAWHTLQALEQLAKECLGGLLVPPLPHQNVEDVVVLIYRSPQAMTLALDAQKHLVAMP
jgi:hypothetical protein